MNDPDYETIGMGTRIFLGGGQGYVIGEGTQHSPKNLNGTLMVKGDAKKMSPEFLQGAAFTRYGTSMYVGLGIPIPILNEGLAKKTSIRDSEIFTDVVDYSVPRRDRPKLRQVTYKELKSGSITINDKKVRVSSLSSLKMAKKVSQTLKSWIEEGTFFLTSPVERLPTDSVFKPFDVIVNSWTSLGMYSRNEDINILKQARDLSKEEAFLFITETMHEKYVLEKFAPTSYFEIEDLLFLEKTNYDQDKKLLSRTWTSYRKQGSKDLVLIGKTEFDLHIYSLSELSSILKEAGWEVMTDYGSLSSSRPSNLLSLANIVARAINCK
jgi:hypothetical protein